MKGSKAIVCCLWFVVLLFETLHYLPTSPGLVCGLWFVVCGSFIRDARAFLSIANCFRLSAVFCIGFRLSPFSCICIRVRRAACSVQLYLYSLAAYGLQLAAVFCIPFRLYSVFLIAFMPFAFMPLRLSFQLYSITLQ